MRCLLEYENRGELYTDTQATEESVIEVLSLFDDATTFYCGLADVENDAGVSCVGASDRRIIEVRVGGDVMVLAHDVPDEGVEVQLRLSAEHRIGVPERETFTHDECVEALLSWLRFHEVPRHLIQLEKSYAR